MQRTVPLFILTVTGKFMPKDLLYQNRVPSTMCHKRIQGRYSMLELDEGKLSRPVLRRGCDMKSSQSLLCLALCHDTTRCPISGILRRCAGR